MSVYYPDYPSTLGRQDAQTALLTTIAANTGGSPTGSATAANQVLEIAALNTIIAGIPVTGPLTDAQLRLTPVPVSGTVAATQSGTWNITNVSGTVSLPTGASTETTLQALVTAVNNLSTTNLSNVLTSSHMLIGNASNVAQDVAMTGDGSMSNAGVLTLANVARSKLATGTAYRIIANNVSGVMSENAALTISRAIVSDANGQLVAATTTTTEINYVSGVTAQLRGQDWFGWGISAGQTTSSNVTGNATGLTWNVGASETWEFEFVLFGGCSTVNGTKFGLTFPSGGVVKAAQIGVRGGSTGVQWENVFATSGTLSSAAQWTLVSVAQTCWVKGVIINSATPGAVQLQFASATNTDTSTISANSFVRAHRIS